MHIIVNRAKILLTFFTYITKHIISNSMEEAIKNINKIYNNDVIVFREHSYYLDRDFYLDGDFSTPYNFSEIISEILPEITNVCIDDMINNLDFKDFSTTPTLTFDVTPEPEELPAVDTDTDLTAVNEDPAFDESRLSPEELKMVEGIGDTLANNIFKYFHKDK